MLIVNDPGQAEDEEEEEDMTDEHLPWVKPNFSSAQGRQEQDFRSMAGSQQWKRDSTVAIRSVSQRTSLEKVDANEAAALATDLSNRLTLNQKRVKVLPQVVIDKLRITEDSKESINLLNQALRPGGITHQKMRLTMKKPVPSNRMIDIDQILEAKRNEKQSSSLAM